MGNHLNGTRQQLPLPLNRGSGVRVDPAVQRGGQDDVHSDSKTSGSYIRSADPQDGWWRRSSAHRGYRWRGQVSDSVCG